MNRIVAVAGLHLDRAWIELGPTFGEELRSWSRRALATVVEEARQRDAAALVVMGDLVDRTTVLPETLDYVAAVLGSFGRPVLVVPGRTDWWSADGPYAMRGWPDNVEVVTNGEFAPTAAAPSVWAAAWTAPNSASSSARLPAGDPMHPRVIARPRLADDGLNFQHGHDLVLVCPDLVHGPGASVRGTILEIERSDGRFQASTADLPGAPGRLAVVDVSDCESTHDLVALVARAAGTDLAVVRLTGRLAPSVLLPGNSGQDLPEGIVLDLGDLNYGVEIPEPGDRSTRAEFLRAMSDTNRFGERVRHQTTALGLAALAASIEGA